MVWYSVHSETFGRVKALALATTLQIKVGHGVGYVLSRQNVVGGDEGVTADLVSRDLAPGLHQ